MQYYMFNKPRGCVTAARDARWHTVMDYFPPLIRQSCFPVGRLDKDTEGFLLITDDGTLCARLTHPCHHVKKTYFFRAIGTLTEEDLCALRTGVLLAPGEYSRPAEVSCLGRGELSDILPFLNEREAMRARKHLHSPVCWGTITLTQGKKHQVRRMLGIRRAHVVFLRRVSVGAVRLDEKLAPGFYRPLTEEEINILYNAEKCK